MMRFISSFSDFMIIDYGFNDDKMSYLLKKKIDKNTLLLIGQLQNTKEQLNDRLKKYLSQDNIKSLHDKLSNIKNVRRQNEILFTHLLANKASSELNIVPPEGIIIGKQKNGKPIINKGYISISHTSDIVAVLISTVHKVGIDIEFPRTQVNKIIHKFLNQKEIDSIASYSKHDCTKLLTSLWCAKETLFKFYGKGNVDFANNILINIAGTLDDIILKGKLIFPNFKKDVPLHIINHDIPYKDEQLIITYCCGNI